MSLSDKEALTEVGYSPEAADDFLGRYNFRRKVARFYDRVCFSSFLATVGQGAYLAKVSSSPDWLKYSCITAFVVAIPSAVLTLLQHSIFSDDITQLEKAKKIAALNRTWTETHGHPPKELEDKFNDSILGLDKI